MRPGCWSEPREPARGPKPADTALGSSGSRAAGTEPPLGGGRQEALSPSGSWAASGKAPGACGGSWRVGEEQGHLTTREGRSGGWLCLERWGPLGPQPWTLGCFSHLSGPDTYSSGPGLWPAPVHVFLVLPHLLCPMEAGYGDMPTVTQSGQHSDPGLSHESLPRKPHAPLPPGPSLEDLPSHRWLRASFRGLGVKAGGMWLSWMEHSGPRHH